MLMVLAGLGYLIFLWPPLGDRLFFPYIYDGENRMSEARAGSHTAEIAAGCQVDAVLESLSKRSKAHCIFGADVPSDQCVTSTMITLKASGESWNCGFSIGGAPGRSAPHVEACARGK
jgi:hypothetical protein